MARRWYGPWVAHLLFELHTDRQADRYWWGGGWGGKGDNDAGKILVVILVVVGLLVALWWIYKEVSCMTK